MENQETSAMGQMVRQELMVIYTYIYYAFLKILYWFLFFIPAQKQRITDESDKRAGMHKTQLKRDQWQDSIVTFQSYLAQCRSLALDTRKTVHQGGPACNSGIITMDGVPGRILDYQKAARPLVVIFGSCSCPPFMADFDKLCRMSQEYSDISDFLVIYIEEAHPSDGWAFRGNIDIKTHRSINDRISAARVLQKKKDVGPMSVVVDCMEDECNKAYGGLFERLYVIQQGVVKYQGGRGPAGFKVGEVEDWLKKYRDMKL